MFRFPHHDEARMRLWVSNVKRKNWEPSANSRICALHFTRECFHSDPGRRRRLIGTAVPTVFTFSRDGGNRTSTTQEVRLLTEVSDPVYLDHPYSGVAVSGPSTSTEASGAANDDRRHEATGREGDRVGEESRVDVPASAEQTGVGESPDTQMALHKLHVAVQMMGKKLLTCRKKLKSEKQKSRRLKRKISWLTGVVHELQHKLRTMRQNAQTTASSPRRTSDGEVKPEPEALLWSSNLTAP
ncbi:peroxynitrite isomerase THAP4-like isoform X2 [Cebidichthys violaceus]|uniref:peroxynitrite isomerase THAP4-like isoform X2 n=1 Tax=Cebidichthys violaceus TaxID=271503 RepID=UPI0035CB1C90